MDPMEPTGHTSGRSFDQGFDPATGLPVPGQHGRAPSEKGSGRNLARLIALLVVAAVVVAFVVQNSQNVPVHVLFLTDHSPLVYIVLGCLVVGVIVGYVAGMRRARRKQERTRRRRREV